SGRSKPHRGVIESERLARWEAGNVKAAAGRGDPEVRTFEWVSVARPRRSAVAAGFDDCSFSERPARGDSGDKRDYSFDRANLTQGNEDANGGTDCQRDRSDRRFDLERRRQQQHKRRRSRDEAGYEDRPRFAGRRFVERNFSGKRYRARKTGPDRRDQTGGGTTHHGCAQYFTTGAFYGSSLRVTRERFA